MEQMPLTMNALKSMNSITKKRFKNLYALVILAFFLIFGIFLFKIVSIFAADPLDVIVDDYSDYIEVYAESSTGSSQVMSIDYSIDDGTTWHNLPADDGDNGGDYGGVWAQAFIDSECDIEPGIHDVYVRAVDEDGGEWPLGYSIVQDFQGSNNNLEVVILEEAGDRINVEVGANYDNYCDENPINIASVEYRIDGGAWTALLNAIGYGTESVEGYIPAEDIPQGTVTIEIRSFDTRWNLEWPLDGVYPSITTSIGTQGAGSFSMGPVFYTEDFENGVGTIISNNGSQNGDFASSIGDEWSINYNSGFGRVRIQDSGYQRSGNGAATLDTPASGTQSSFDLILTQDLSDYNGATDLGLHFYFMWHDNQPNGSQVNKVYIRESNTASWIEAYDFTANADLGNYVEVGIDIDELLSGTLTDTFQVMFRMEGAWTADSTTFYEGYSIDDLELGGTFQGHSYPGIIYQEDFEDGVGTEYLILDKNLGDSIGAEWYANYIASGPSRIRIQGNGFQRNGNGTMTLDSFDDTGFSGNSNTEVTLSVDLREYRNANDLLLQFYYMWHDDNDDSNFQAKVFMRGSINDSWIEVYDLSDFPNLGVYKEVELDIDDLLSSQNITQTFQIRFVLVTDGKALTTVNNAGYSIDDLTIYGTKSDSITMGPIFYTENFDNGIGTEINTNGVLSSTLGDEWTVEFNGDGRLRIHADGFEISGGAVSLDSSVANSDSSVDLILTYDMRVYEGASDIALRFNYNWHDNLAYNSQQNKVFVRASSSDSWIEAYNLQTSPILGGYKEVLVDIDDLISTSLSETFQIRFHFEGDNLSETLSSKKGFSIDDLTLGGTQILSDLTPPDIIFTQSPWTYSATDLNIEGTAYDGESDITNVEVKYKNVNDVDYMNVTVTADDGSFDSDSEDFSSSISGLTGGESYNIVVIAYNSASLSREYNFTTTIDVTHPEMSVINLGQEPIDSTSVTYTGNITDNLSGVASVEYWVYDPSIGIEIAPTAVNADDGAFDSISENFTFTISGLLDGTKLIVMKAYDSVGNIFGDPDGFIVDRIIINSVDTTPPEIDLHEVLPDPIHDSTPLITGRVEDDKLDKTSNIAQIFYRLDGGEWIEVNSFDGIYDSSKEDFSFTLEELSLGSHTIEIRAIDASGNDTDVSGTNVSDTFVVVEPEETNSVKVQKISDFVTHTDHDLIASQDIIWGRGRLRLAQTFSVVGMSQLTSGHFGPRYDTMGNFQISLTPGTCDGGGFWTAKYRGYFSYYSYATGTEYNFDLASFGLSTDNETVDIVEVPNTSTCQIWLLYDWGLLGIDFGNSVIDGTWDSYINYTVGSSNSILRLDSRDTNNYGLYIQAVGGIHYLRPHSFNNTADDEWVTYDQVSVGERLDNVTAIFLNFDGGNNEVWFADYDDKIVVVNDQGTPLNLADDVITTYGNDGGGDITDGVFAIGKDKNNNIYYAGNPGLRLIQRNGTFDSSDDSNELLASTFQLGQNVAQDVVYFPGDDIVGEYYYVTTRQGQLTYVGTNDTIEDHLDDEIIVLQLTNDVYPTQISDFMVMSDGPDNAIFRVILDRQGVFDINIDKDFVDHGTAVTDIYSTLEGDYLDLDFIRLDTVGFVYTDGSVTYRVSNDGGFTWKPIAIGETVNFDDPGYQLVFAMDLHHGSTPVINYFQLSYSAYKSDNYRDLHLDIEDEPPIVPTNTEFSFRLLALDELDNPFEDPQNVILQLRRLEDNTIVDSFNINDVVIQNGEAIINNAKADVLGLHYLYATNGIKEAFSDPINFIGSLVGEDNEPPEEESLPPFEIENHYVNVLDEDSVEICWTTNLNSVGFIEYRTGDNPILTTPMISEYSKYHCQEIDDVKTDAQYDYKINATSQYLQIAEANGNFLINGDIDTENINKIQSCIDLDVDSYTYISKRIIIPFETIEPSKCILYYGNSVDNLSETYEMPRYSTKHEAMIDLYEINYQKDIFFKIECENEQQQSTCTTYGSIPREEYMQAYSSLDMFLLNHQSILTGILVGGLLFLFAIDSLAYPRFILYAIAWLKDRKKYKKWGIVYDKKKNKPVPFAVLRLYDNAGKLISQQVSNLDGKYGFPIDHGKYRLVVEHPDYRKYKTLVHIASNQNSVAIDIALNASKNRKLFNIRYSLREILSKINTLILLLGLLLSILVILVSPILLNYIIFFLYIIQFALLLILTSSEKWGYVFDSKTGEKISGAFVRLFNEDGQVDVQMTDKSGRYGFLVPEGEYNLSVDKQGYKFPSKKQDEDILKQVGRNKLIEVYNSASNDIDLAIPLDKI